MAIALCIHLFRSVERAVRRLSGGRGKTDRTPKDTPSLPSDNPEAHSACCRTPR